jgi:hypothetical protein
MAVDAEASGGVATDKSGARAAVTAGAGAEISAKNVLAAAVDFATPSCGAAAGDGAAPGCCSSAFFGRFVPAEFSERLEITSKLSTTAWTGIAESRGNRVCTGRTVAGLGPPVLTGGIAANARRKSVAADFPGSMVFTA